MVLGQSLSTEIMAAGDRRDCKPHFQAIRVRVNSKRLFIKKLQIPSLPQCPICNDTASALFATAINHTFNTNDAIDVRNIEQLLGKLIYIHTKQINTFIIIHHSLCHYVIMSLSLYLRNYENLRK